LNNHYLCKSRNHRTQNTQKYHQETVQQTNKVVTEVIENLYQAHKLLSKNLYVRQTPRLNVEDILLFNFIILKHL